MLKLPIKSGETVRATIELVDGVVASGTLVTTDGRPAAGVEVYAIDARSSSRESNMTTTDAQGRYQFRVLPGLLTIQLNQLTSKFRFAGSLVQDQGTCCESGSSRSQP